MIHESYNTAMDVAKQEKKEVPTVVSVSLCDNSVSLDIGSLTIHVPWEDVLKWIAWAIQQAKEAK